MITILNNEIISYVFRNHYFIFKRIDIIDEWKVSMNNLKKKLPTAQVISQNLV